MRTYNPRLDRTEEGTLRPSPGCDIHSAAKLAAELASTTGENQVLVFNGVLLTITATSMPSEVRAEYFARLKERG